MVPAVVVPVAVAGAGYAYPTPQAAAASKKRRRGTPVGEDILLRKPDNTWKPFRKPVVVRGAIRRQGQLKDIVRMLIDHGLDASTANIARLGFGRGPTQRGMLQAIAEALLTDDTATEVEAAWAKRISRLIE